VRKILPERDSISIYYIIRAFKILLTIGSDVYDTTLAHERKILATCGSVFRSEQMGQTFLYLCRHGAATAWLLQVQLGFSETGAHRVLKKLKALGIVEPILKVPQRRMKRSGPMPTIWGLVGHCSDEEVARAMTLHYRTLSPKYRAAEKVAQTILDEFKLDQPMEVKYTDIMHRVKAMRIPYSGPDVADLAAQYLHEKGIKVWR